MSYVAAGYAVTLGTLAAYGLWTLRRGRSLARQAAVRAVGPIPGEGT
jgi:hypothetical protein